MSVYRLKPNQKRHYFLLPAGRRLQVPPLRLRYPGAAQGLGSHAPRPAHSLPRGPAHHCRCSIHCRVLCGSLSSQTVALPPPTVAAHHPDQTNRHKTPDLSFLHLSGLECCATRTNMQKIPIVPSRWTILVEFSSQLNHSWPEQFSLLLFLTKETLQSPKFFLTYLFTVHFI